jgi:hypothetical protein
MDGRKILLLGALLSLATGAWSQDSPFFGTWRQNLSKSKIARGEPQKDRILVISPYGQNGWMRVVLNQNQRGEWVEEHFLATLDGKDHPTLGNDPRVVSLKQLDASTVEVSLKRNGKVSSVQRLTLSPDGKTLTQLGSGVDGSGQRYANDLRVYDRL